MGETALVLEIGIRILSPLVLASWLWKKFGVSLSLDFLRNTTMKVMSTPRAAVSPRWDKTLKAEACSKCSINKYLFYAPLRPQPAVPYSCHCSVPLGALSSCELAFQLFGYLDLELPLKSRFTSYAENLSLPPTRPIVSYAAICDMGLFVFFQSEKNVSIFLLLKVISIHCQMRKEFYRPCHLHMRIK